MKRITTLAAIAVLVPALSFAKEITITVPDEPVVAERINRNFDGSFTFTNIRVSFDGVYTFLGHKKTEIGLEKKQLEIAGYACSLFGFDTVINQKFRVSNEVNEQNVIEPTDTGFIVHGPQTYAHDWHWHLEQVTCKRSLVE